MIKTTNPAPNFKKITVVVHNTAVSRFDQPLQYNAVNNHHKNKDWGGGWKQTEPSKLGSWVGYNFFCEATGLRYQTRLWGEETIAAKGHNCDVPERCGFLHYCWAGNFAKERPTTPQVNDLKYLKKELESQFLGAEIVFVQHWNVDPSRTCAELTIEELAAILKEEDDASVIARLQKENEWLKSALTIVINEFSKYLKK